MRKTVCAFPQKGSNFQEDVIELGQINQSDPIFFVVSKCEGIFKEELSVKKQLIGIMALLSMGAAFSAQAEKIGCVTTAWKLLGANHQVCVESFADPVVKGVTCHVSQAKKGGITGSLGLATDPSLFSLACRQTGPITMPAKLPQEESIFSASTSVLFKDTQVRRMWDEKNKTLVYVAISRKLIDGSPVNSISTVPVMPWGGR